jgi:hypothetical protein
MKHVSRNKKAVYILDKKIDVSKVSDIENFDEQELRKISCVILHTGNTDNNNDDEGDGDDASFSVFLLLLLFSSSSSSSTALSS